MTVRKIVSRDQAVRALKRNTLYPANEWILGDKEQGTPFILNRRLAPELAWQLRFVSKGSEPNSLFFIDVAKKNLDVQATRGVRELTANSAELLDRIIGVTDRLKDLGVLITATEELLEQSTLIANSEGTYSAKTQCRENDDLRLDSSPPSFFSAD